ncbi:MAG: DUF3298 and DUF4163 domain-containing protein [Cytophagaceae bacterium]|jgi:hypothetical protein|nr:DUF3298 and DUF4163 domain-containing protein [Cytophagaceae bacterium]
MNSIGKKYLVLPVIVLVLLMQACTGQDQDGTLRTDTTAVWQPQFNPVFYKHFKGTLGPQQVVVDLTSDGKALSGSYYFLGSGELIAISGKIDSLGKMEWLESVNQKKVGSLSGLIAGDSLIGFWFSRDKKKQLPCNLREDYQLALPLRPYFLHDSIRLTGDANGPVGTYSKLVILPIDSAIPLQQLFKKAQFSSKRLSLRPEELLAEEHLEFKNSYLELKQDYSPELGISSFSWDYSNVNTVLYNDNGYLSLRSANYEFTGGAHGDYSSICLVFSKDSARQIQLKDIFAKGFEKKLNQVINLRLRKQFDVQPNETLADVGFLVEYLSYSANFYLTSSGVGFVYAPSEVAQDALGEIEIFVPFDEVKSILNKNFKLRSASNS